MKTTTMATNGIASEGGNRNDKDSEEPATKPFSVDRLLAWVATVWRKENPGTELASTRRNNASKEGRLGLPAPKSANEGKTGMHDRHDKDIDNKGSPGTPEEPHKHLSVDHLFAWVSKGLWKKKRKTELVPPLHSQHPPTAKGASKDYGGSVSSESPKEQLVHHCLDPAPLASWERMNCIKNEVVGVAVPPSEGESARTQTSPALVRGFHLINGSPREAIKHPEDDRRDRKPPADSSTEGDDYPSPPFQRLPPFKCPSEIDLADKSCKSASSSSKAVGSMTTWNNENHGSIASAILGKRKRSSPHENANTVKEEKTGPEVIDLTESE